jgi:hypothetical protein
MLRAADERLIDFDLTLELAAGVLVLHGEADTLKHEPRGLLRDANRAVQFPGRDAILAVGDHPDGREPLVESERRVLKDRPGLQRELPVRVPGLALPTVAGRVEVDGLGPARRAGDAVRPATGHHVLPAVVGAGEVLDGGTQGLRKRRAHISKYECSHQKFPRQVYYYPSWGTNTDFSSSK